MGKLFPKKREQKDKSRKSTSIEDFIKKSKEFSEKLKVITKEPIEFKKIFE